MSTSHATWPRTQTLPDFDAAMIQRPADEFGIVLDDVLASPMADYRQLTAVE